MKSRLLLILIAAVTLLPACKKKKEGICYCKYLSGDKKEFDLRSLDRTAALDSCRTLDRNAEAFAGECTLKD